MELSLHDALLRGGIFRDLPGDDRTSALRALVERLPLPGPGVRLEVLERVLRREQTGTTAVGAGIALPHPLQPLEVGPGQPIAALGILATPIDFEAPDGEPVGALLLSICPTPRLHLALLRQAARAFHDDRFRDLVLGGAPNGAILSRLAIIEDAGLPRSAAS